LVPTGSISMKFGIELFFENPLKKLNFHLDTIEITGTLHEDQYTILIICLSVLLGMKNFSDTFREKFKPQNSRSIK
jgi:hypothetical protein